MDRPMPRPASRSSPGALLDLATVAVQSHPDHKYSHADIESSERITLPPLSDVAYRARPRNNFWRSFPPPPDRRAGTGTSQDISGAPEQLLALGLDPSYHAPRSDLATHGTALHRPSASQRFTSRSSLSTLMSTPQNTESVSPSASGTGVADRSGYTVGFGRGSSESHDGDNGAGRPHPLANLNLDQTNTERKVAQWEAQAQRILQPLEMPRTPPATARSQPTPPPRPHSHSSSRATSGPYSHSHFQPQSQSLSQSRLQSPSESHSYQIHAQNHLVLPSVAAPRSSAVFSPPTAPQRPGESWTIPSQPPPHRVPSLSELEREREHHRVHPPPHGLISGLLPSHAHQAAREAYIAQYNARVQAIVGPTATTTSSAFDPASARLTQDASQTVAATAVATATTTGKATTTAPAAKTDAVPSPIESDESATPGKPDWSGGRGNRVGEMTVGNKGLIFIDDPLSALVRMGERSALSEHELRTRLAEERPQAASHIGVASLLAQGDSSTQGGEGRQRTERINLDMVAFASEVPGDGDRHQSSDHRREGSAAAPPTASSVSMGSDEPVFDDATQRVSADESSSAGSESDETNTPTATSRSSSGENDGDDPTDPTYHLHSRSRKPSSSVPLPTHSRRGRPRYRPILPTDTSTSATSSRNNNADSSSLRIKREPISPPLSALVLPHSATPTVGAGGTGTDSDRPAKRRKVWSEPLGSVAPEGREAGHDDSGIGLGVMTGSRSRSGGTGRRDKEKRKLQNKVSQKSYRDRKKRKAEQMETAVEEAMELNIVLQRKLKDAEDRNLRLARENGTLKRKVIEMERTPSMTTTSTSISTGSAVGSLGHGSRDSGSGSGGGGGGGGIDASDRRKQVELDNEQEEQRAQVTSNGMGQSGEAMPVDKSKVEQEIGVERDTRSKSEALQVGSEVENSHGGKAGAEEVDQLQGPAGAFDIAD